jgi:alkanesulfonate monooxygenase SsuD/methylene tetrahydromethanopterin reductase-like flavin-dependent oxidoreductase (luciferase family)
MEFGIFVQGHVPRRRAAEDPDYEHRSLLGDLELVKAADKAGFKYAWASEHHFLDEYSHLSASEIFLAYAAAQTERIHLASGIWNVNPQVNHPYRLVERATMMDHLSDGRFELGVGRGAGHHEVTGFGIESTDATKEPFEEIVREIPKMFGDEWYEFHGKYFDAPKRNVLPKPWRKPHPPIWQACGNPPTFAKAGQKGLGAIGFNFSAAPDMQPMIDAYKEAVADAEPIGAYVNDNVMITNTIVCLEDGARARKVASDMGSGLLISLVFRYHTTFPKPQGIPEWPELVPDFTVEAIEQRIKEGFILCGSPDEVLGQIKKYEEVGADQIVFGLPIDMGLDNALESIELFGKYVIPEYDKDPVHRSTKFREAAAVSANA